MPPEFLYKYLTATADDVGTETRSVRQERLNLILTDNKLYFAHPSRFNDPMDTKPHFIFHGSAEQLKKLRQKNIFDIVLRKNPELQGRIELLLKVAEYQEKLPNVGDEEFSNFIQDATIEYVREVGILCLSEIGNCPVMFYHYGDAHKGMCLKFRADSDYFAMAEKVTYSVNYPEIDYFADDDGTEFDKIFLSKYKSWEYEKEWRIVDFQNKFNAGLSRLVPYSSELLDAVIFGYLMPKCEKIRIAELLSKAGRNVRLLQARLAQKSFELEIVDWVGD